MATVKVFCFNAFSENTFVIIEDTDCIIVDPGCYEKNEYDELKKYISDNQLKPQSIINTHCHIDHILGVEHLKNHYNIPFIIHRKEIPILKSGKVLAPVYGFHQFAEPEADSFIEEGQSISLGKSEWKVLDVPGHSPGHIALYEAGNKLCLSGDVLFMHSIGRTDLPGGDYDTLIQSIRSKLFTLPGEVTIFPGHGPETSVDEEKLNNPFCGLNAG